MLRKQTERSWTLCSQSSSRLSITAANCSFRRWWMETVGAQSGPDLQCRRFGARSGRRWRNGCRYLDLLVDPPLVRRLPPWCQNASKRLVKSTRLYVRGSGIVHALLGIREKEALLGHPVVGQTSESFVMEALIAAAPDGTEAHYYRTSNGIEVDRLLTSPERELWAICVFR